MTSRRRGRLVSLNEIEALRRANLIRGGSLDNAIVLTPDGMLNQTGLRFRDEFVRHKILDIIGDLALAGNADPGKGCRRTQRSHHARGIDVETPARPIGVGHCGHALEHQSLVIYHLTFLICHFC